MDLDPPALNTTELIRNPNYKECRTDVAVYFLGGPFSQWSRHGFNMEIGGVKYRFSCAEQYMMAAKADLFNDKETFNKILQAKHPAEIKALGRLVKGFDKEVWDRECDGIVLTGTLAKFRQNPGIRKYLLDTKDMLLVEGAHYDRVWGVGLAFDDPAILDKANWQGTNKLGNALTKARKIISEEVSQTTVK